MRTLSMLAVLLLVAGIGGMQATADTGGDPWVVTIYDIDFNDVDSLTVTTGEIFTLYGVPIGDTPF